MRKMTLSEIQSNMMEKRQRVDYSVNLFRGKSKEEGWVMKRTRPRNSDEIKALNYLSRNLLCSGMKDGSIRYDQERRVLILAKYSRS